MIMHCHMRLVGGMEKNSYSRMYWDWVMLNIFPHQTKALGLKTLSQRQLRLQTQRQPLLRLQTHSLPDSSKCGPDYCGLSHLRHVLDGLGVTEAQVHNEKP